MTTDDAPKPFAPDGLYLPQIKRHSLEKITLHNRYAAIFSKAMAKQWKQRAYIGLFAGAGAAELVETGDTVETSALAVQQQPVPFTHCVYVDCNPLCIAALRARVGRSQSSTISSFIEADVNACAPEVLRALPPYGPDAGLLSFCFVDPFDLQLQFSTIRALSRLKIDFLVLLMVGTDGRRNFHNYLRDPSSSRIETLLDSPDWRREYQQLPGKKNALRFLLDRFDQKMISLGYLSAREDVHPVCAAGTKVLLYMMAFYSKSELGRRFWRESRRTVSAQLDLL